MVEYRVPTTELHRSSSEGFTIASDGQTYIFFDRAISSGGATERRVPRALMKTAGFVNTLLFSTKLLGSLWSICRGRRAPAGLSIISD